MDTVYLYLVYENYRHYKDYNKFHEISLTTNQVEVKEKYIDKDTYKMEFFEVPIEYAEKVFRYIQERFFKSPFPLNLRSGELQSACSDFIKKINSIRQEKGTSPTITYPTITTTISSHLPLPSISSLPQLLPLALSLPSPSPSTHKLIALIGNKNNGGVTVISNGDNVDFLHQISQHPTLQLLQHALMTVEEVDSITTSFYQEFSHLKMPPQPEDFNLAWYRMSEQVVLIWLQGRNNAKYHQADQSMASPPLSEETIPPLFDVDDIIISGINKKRKMAN